MQNNPNNYSSPQETVLEPLWSIQLRHKVLQFTLRNHTPYSDFIKYRLKYMRGVLTNKKENTNDSLYI